MIQKNIYHDIFMSIHSYANSLAHSHTLNKIQNIGGRCYNMIYGQHNSKGFLQVLKIPGHWRIILSQGPSFKYATRNMNNVLTHNNMSEQLEVTMSTYLLTNGWI